MDINKTLVKKTKKSAEWYIINAKNYKLGRLTSKIAYILKNKNSTDYLPYQGSNSRIIIINSKDIKVTGKKEQQKLYKRHSGKPGGLKIETFSKLQKRLPNKIIEYSLKGMLPKNALGRAVFKQVRIYQDQEHPHKAQNPIKIT
uniref:Large ribosomal subunit protein uL13c n=1 Tax=Tolypiocladia glomerulata TaxID=860646 RepID=A0A1Z1MVB2_9FLOR|nr:ribosomal protein L13 [Tolypiocladia glomerulata]ARW69801.1 ribosomal protein L13 [Tolypiocladia glomerulata]